ncbi:MAG TPA: flagellar hook capping FlgD N-terminal domain-containing protein [Verrucomicrobiae bacterium]|nr:flagellar hook capping FlgD N-terminal domain-containing protein [Verrucomicrobiae bacterium]
MSTNSIPPVSSLTSTTGTSATSNTSNSELSPDAFLQLLTAELQNQDPTNPQDPTESVTQLAQFSELQYQSQLTDSFAAFQSNFGVLQAASLVGKQVSVEVEGSGGTSSTETGTISTIAVQNGQPYFTMTGSNGQTLTDNNGNPLLFSLQQIVGIGSSSSTSTDTNSGGNSGTNGGNGTGGGG